LEEGQGKAVSAANKKFESILPFGKIHNVDFSFKTLLASIDAPGLKFQERGQLKFLPKSLWVGRGVKAFGRNFFWSLFWSFVAFLF
jgi:hypothetical protein